MAGSHKPILFLWLNLDETCQWVVSAACKTKCVFSPPSLSGHLDPGFLASDKTSAGNAPLNEEINIASSDSEVEIVGVQEHAR